MNFTQYKREAAIKYRVKHTESTEINGLKHV